ncbi:DUF4355 domain-containing protein [Enterococcus sp.]|uniref:DUF4355 domain-containing protein n=1 Tax=Enterococcus sp. TaxID=35783 RepID=UPI002899D834|nr:DUF4355 domain-containing protein [Enterococcus sp.]
MKENKLLMNRFVGQLCGNRLMKMRLQFFADGGEGNGSEGEQDGDLSDDSKPISFANQSEFDSFMDKRVSKAIETAQAKWEKAEAEKIEKAKSEGERLAKLSAEQREKEEQRKKEEADSKREQDLTKRELRLQALEELTERKLPQSLIDAVVLTDADACANSIETIEKVFRDAVEVGVNERLARSAETPKFGNVSKDSKIGEIGTKLAEQKYGKKTESKFFN